MYSVLVLIMSIVKLHYVELNFNSCKISDACTESTQQSTFA